jgi:hypothetical protein
MPMESMSPAPVFFLSRAVPTFCSSKAIYTRLRMVNWWSARKECLQQPPLSSSEITSRRLVPKLYTLFSAHFISNRFNNSRNDSRRSLQLSTWITSRFQEMCTSAVMLLFVELW